jgi:hypothetical protein
MIGSSMLPTVPDSMYCHRNIRYHVRNWRAIERHILTKWELMGTYWRGESLYLR